MNDAFPMVFSDTPTGLTFIWKGPEKTTIEITREEVHLAPAEHIEMGIAVTVTEHVTDQNIPLYDHEMGRVTLEPTWDAFVARVAEWIADSYDLNEEQP